MMSKRLFVFAHDYPASYKPYYDTQFADLARSGHALTIFATGRLGRNASAKSIRYDLLSRTHYVPATLRSIPRSLPGLARAALRHPAAVVNSARHTRSDDITMRARAAHFARMLLVDIDEPDACIIHGVRTATMFPWLRVLFPAAPIALYYHGGDVPQVATLPLAATRDAFRTADVVFTNSDSARAQAIGRGCPEDRISILPVGFDLDDFTPARHRNYRRSGVLTILSAGRMSEEKGLIHGIQAIQQLVQRGRRNIVYSLVGDGYQRGFLEDYVKANGLESHVRFLGLLPHDDLIREMGESDVLLLPSIPLGTCAETQGCTVQEAMLMKAVVVATNVGGVPEFIPETMKPLLVQPGDAAAIADALARIADMPSEQVRMLGDSGRTFVAERFDIRMLNARMLQVLEASGAAASQRFRETQAAGR